jgi:lysylphosphatidylglycerol synthetase-like protein (DUF2156 family)
VEILGTVKLFRRTVRSRRRLLLAAAALAILAAACLWMGWNSWGIQGAYFTEDFSAPSAAGDDQVGISAATILWFVAAGASSVAAVIVAWRARRC